jgi:hypothetical protein
MLTAANDHLKSKGIKIETGMIMDATLISAPSPVAQDMNAGASFRIRP